MNKSVQELQLVLVQLGAKLPYFGADGYMGKETFRAIDSLEIPKHVKIAMKEVGTKEIRGEADHPRIIEYHLTSAGRYSEDEVPWCGSFVNWVMLKSGVKITVRYPERAKSWLLFDLFQREPTVGSIAIKSRNGGGHVCFVLGKTTDGNLLCLGGNQSDEVNIREYSPTAFLGYRKAFGITQLPLSVLDIDPRKAGKEN